jgi:hypothetical protein
MAADAKFVYYESAGGRGGPALILPPGTPAGAKADLYVIPENGEPGYLVRDVPKRAEGGGHTWRASR